LDKEELASGRSSFTVDSRRVLTHTQAQSQATAAPQPPVLNAPVKEFITPIHAYFKPGIPAGVTS